MHTGICGREDLTPVLRLATLHTLVCDGHVEGQEGEDGHLEGVDVWFGMKHLVHCIIKLCLLSHMGLHTVKCILHLSCVHCCHHGEVRAIYVFSAGRGLQCHSLEVSAVAGLGLRAVPEH